MEGLWEDEPTPLRRGPVRRALDAEVRRVREDPAVTLSEAGVAALRALANQLDALEYACRGPRAKAYDRIPLATLAREFRESHAVVFAVTAAAHDPIADALEQFMAGEGAPAAGNPT